MRKMQFITHPIPPVYDKDSKILILGSFPSVKSREEGFFYGNPKNRFWKVLSEIFGGGDLNTVADKKEFLFANKIALYDVIYSCEIEGSSDSSIKNVKAADIDKILSESKIRVILLNGKTAGRLYEKYIRPENGISYKILPSSSPANAAYKYRDILKEWKAAFSLFADKQ